MIYTIGDKLKYLHGFEDGGGILFKLKYGSVWKERRDAEVRAAYTNISSDETFAVFGVDADWDKDTNELPNVTWRELSHDAQLIILPDYDDTVKYPAMEEFILISKKQLVNGMRYQYYCVDMGCVIEDINRILNNYEDIKSDVRRLLTKIEFNFLNGGMDRCPVCGCQLPEEEHKKTCEYKTVKDEV